MRARGGRLFATGRKLRVYLADDQMLFRTGVRVVLENEPDMEVVGEASTAAELTSRLPKSGADVAIVEVAMPGMGGASVPELLRRYCPTVKVIALSGREERASVAHLLAAGAAGFLAKRSKPEDLLRAVRCVAAGGIYVGPRLADSAPPNPAARGRGRSTARAPGLSERETSVLREIARGHPLKEIAEGLSLSARTVETYRCRAMEKLELKSRADIVRYAAVRGWLRLD